MNFDLRSAARALGGDVVRSSGVAYILCPGPQHSPRDRSLSVTPSAKSPDGFVCNSFAGDDWRTCHEHVLARLGLPRNRHQADRQPKQNGGPLFVWKNARPDPLVEQYLRSRGLAFPDDIAGRVIRFDPSCPFGPGIRRPCMLAAFRSIADDSLCAIQRTALTPDGRKIGRMMWGPVRGAAIKIDADMDIEQGLVIGEGLETVLAARQLGFRPAWALGSAGAIASFPVLSGIDTLTVLAETDDAGANSQAIQKCATRWAASGREIVVVTPRVGGDLNGALQRWHD